MPLPSQLEGQDWFYKVSKRGSSWNLGRKWVLVHFELKRTQTVTKNLVFLTLL